MFQRDTDVERNAYSEIEETILSGSWFAQLKIEDDNLSCPVHQKKQLERRRAGSMCELSRTLAGAQ